MELFIERNVIKNRKHRMKKRLTKHKSGGAKSGGARSGGAKSGGAISGGARSGGGITKAKKEIREVMRKHGISAKHVAHGIKLMDGAGIFDVLKKVVSKGIEFYGKHKDVINKGIGLAVKHAPEIIKTIKEIKGGAKKAGKKKSLPPALREWNRKLDEYQAKHGCSRREAMSALKKK